MGHKILITGGAGRLAKFTSDVLRKDHEVSLFDIVTPENSRAPWTTDLLFIKGDLTSLGDCMRAITLSEADVIVHLGAITNSTDLIKGRKLTQTRPEDLTMKTNVMGTYYLMDAARRLGVKKVIFGSSFFTLGLGFRISDKPFKVEYLPMDEKHPSRPEDTYSLSKVLGEEIVHAYSRAYGIKAVSLRFMGISYPVISEHKFNYIPEPNPTHIGGPNNGTTHQYVDGRDIANAIKLAVEKELENDYEEFFIATDNKFPGETRKIVESIYPDLKDMAANLKGEEGIISDKKLRDMLGYEPKYSWKNELKK